MTVISSFSEKEAILPKGCNMALVALDYQEILKRECNVVDDTVVDSTIPLWWEMYSSKSSLNLTYWYTRRHVLMYLQGKTAELIDITVGPDRQLLSQHFKAITKMLEQTETELKRIDPDYEEARIGTFGSVSPDSVLPDTLAEQQELWESGMSGFGNLTSTQTGMITGR